MDEPKNEVWLYLFLLNTLDKSNQTLEIGLLIIIHGHVAAIFTIQIGAIFEL